MICRMFYEVNDKVSICIEEERRTFDFENKFSTGMNPSDLASLISSVGSGGAPGLMSGIYLTRS